MQTMPDPQGGPTSDGSAPASAAKSKTKRIVVVLLVLVAAVGGIVAAISAHSSGASAAENGAGESTLVLETFVVNLAGEGRAYLRVSITLGLSHPPEKSEAPPIALVRDTILSVLSAARAEQLLQAEGKRQLKAEVLAALKERVPQLGVENVYFTELLVQM